MALVVFHCIFMCWAHIKDNRGEVKGEGGWYASMENNFALYGVQEINYPQYTVREKVPKTFDFLCIGMSIQPLDFDQPIFVSVTSGERCDKINDCY